VVASDCLHTVVFLSTYIDLSLLDYLGELRRNSPGGSAVDL